MPAATAAPREIVIVGGGTAGWMCAAALARFLEHGWRVTLVESEEIGTVGVGEATIPQLQLYLRGLGVAEDDFLRATQGTFKLGIQFKDWLEPGHSYIHTFAQAGPGLGLLPFHQYWLRARAQGGAQPLDAYALNAVAANAGRFTRTAPDPRARTTPLAYAFHIDASLLARHLRSYAEARGVVRREGRIARAGLREADGFVSHLELADGSHVAGELFLDCSGFRGLVIGEALGVPYEDWTRWLPCDRALAVPCARTDGPLTPYTRSTASAAGWRWRIPLQHRTGNGYVYSSAHLGEDEARAELLAGLDGEPQAEPRPLRFTTGRRARFWEKNCVAIGLASGFLEPLESTSIHLVQSAIARVLQFLPERRLAAADVAAYNRLTAYEYERIRDFLVLHYRANRRPGAFWRMCRALPLSDALAEKLEVYAAGGRVVRDQDELFTEASWQQVMQGQGIEPQAWHPLAEQLSPDDLKVFLDAASAGARAQVAAMPTHAAYVAAHCVA